MNRTIIVMLGLSLIACTSKGKKTKKTPEKAPTMVRVWDTKGFKVPESVMYDPKSQLLFVSNIGGNPTQKNKNGFIATVNLMGVTQNPFWLTGLNAPKGMGILGETLYVTDIDRVIAINIPKAAIEKTWTVEGAKFLNDIAIGGDGSVFITDMMAKKIHIIKGGQLDTFLVLQYDRPNGLFTTGSTLWVGTALGLVKIDTRSKTITLEIDHKGGIDGLKALGDGGFLVSDWKGKVEIIKKGKAPVVLSDTSHEKINAADFEFIPQKNLIIVPTFFDNRIVAYQLR
ncbi:ATP-binding protein [Myxococcota bacterium]|nr:ATP-binding protein [Myxococcota bacterium]